MKISELSGELLDFWVAKAEGHALIEIDTKIGRCFIKRIEQPRDSENVWLRDYIPSEDWSDGGPIIEREGININRAADGWVASVKRENAHGHYVGEGDTALEAAMRCYVASKFGDEVEDADQA